jgi:hypothetical protein
MPYAEAVAGKTREELEELAKTAESRSVRRRAKTQLSHPEPPKAEKPKKA